MLAIELIGPPPLKLEPEVPAPPPSNISPTLSYPNILFLLQFYRTIHDFYP
jgi:hypothetical protein